MKKMILDCKTGENQEIDLSPEELEQADKDRLVWENEQSKPLPPKPEEQIADLQKQLSVTQDALNFMIMGGM